VTRQTLLRTFSLAALAAGVSHGAHAATTVPSINGGGASSPAADYAAPNNGTTPTSEFSLFNSTYAHAKFGTYWSNNSGTGQLAFINNDLTCDINAVTGNNGGACAGTPGGANTVHYAASDNALKAAQVSSWATSSFGQSAAGNLIQIPVLGTGTAIIVNDTNVAGSADNGKIELSDNDLCGIFSGLITNFDQITDSKTLQPAAGAITFVYRSDSAATSYFITNHLSQVCTTSNTAAGVTFTATTTFASLFPSGITSAIPNAVGQSGNKGVADYLAGLSSSGAVPQAIGYTSPDWTSLTPNSPQRLSNGNPSPLVVAALFNGTKAYTPTTTNIEAGLTHPNGGTNPTPPANATDGANPLKWVPVVPLVTTGYPIVGYGTFDLAQCYQNKSISNALIDFFKSHYSTAGYLSIEANNGLVPLSKTKATKFVTAVVDDILGNKSNWNTNIGNATACAGLAGR
jgi:hypothetical protein